MCYYNNLPVSEPKEWNNICPKCNSIIKWSLQSSKPGAKTNVYCSNSLFASRVGIEALRDIKNCFWTGYVVRQKDGGVRFQNEKKEWLKEY
tara:strand:- start:1979 stop:2251 length:273 start_codon:yes stop_codon:yes gene_type:complete